MHVCRSIWNAITPRLAAASLSCIAAGASFGATYRVSVLAGPGGDGLSWATAFDSIGSALVAAEANPGVDDIWVAGGTYRAPLNGWHAVDIRLFGGFAGTESSLAERVLGAHESHLTGDQLGNDPPLVGLSVAAIPGGVQIPPQFAENASRVLTLTGALDGFTVSGVNTSSGAALVIEQATVRNCRFRDNLGGSLLARSATAPALVAHCTFERALTITVGAAINFSPQGGATPSVKTLRVFNCRFHSNSTLSGGAVAIGGSGALLANCFFTGNRSYSGGPAVHIAQSGLTTTAGLPIEIVNCTITRNEQLGTNGSPPISAGVYVSAVRPGQLVSIRGCVMHANLYVGAVPALPVFDIAKATGVSGPLSLQVDRCLASVSTGIPVSSAIPYAPPGFEALSGPDNRVGTPDDLARIIPIETACIDTVPVANLPIDEADLDGDGDTNEIVPLDIDGKPRNFNDPDVADAGGGGGSPASVDCGASEGRGRQGFYIPTADSLSGDIAAERAILYRASRISHLNAGVATISANGGDQPAVMVANVVTLDRIIIATQGDIWIGDATGAGAGLRPQSMLPPGTPFLTARSIVQRLGAFTLEQPARIVVSNELHLAPGTRNGFSPRLELEGSLRNEGDLSLYISDEGAAGRIDITNGGFTQGSGGSEPTAARLRLSASVTGPVSSVHAQGHLSLAGSLELTVVGAPMAGPPIGQSWTLLTGSSRSGLFETAFLPGWADRLVRLVYSGSSRDASVTTVVESRDNVVALDPPLSFPVPGTPRAAAVGHLHAAAYPSPDLAVIVPDPVNPTTAPGLLHVLINLGTTATTWNGYAAVTISKATGIDPSGIVIAELSGDVRNDIAVINRQSGTVRVFINDGADDFPTFTDIATLDTPEGVAAADFDADGDTDLAVTGFSPTENSGGVQILLNAAGSFSPDSFIPLGRRPTALIAADLDHQNGPDLAVADTDDDRAAVLLNAGSTLRAWGRFGPPRFFLCDDEPSSIQPGNIDNGKDDAIVTVNAGGGSVTVLRPTPGDPGSYSPVTGPIGSEPRSVAVIDLNADGLDDIVAVATDPAASERTLRVLIAGFDEDANVQFTAAPNIETPEPPTIVLAADLDSDGLPDLLTVGPQTVVAAARGPSPRGSSSNVAAVLARPPCPGDFNNDAQVTTADLVFFLGRFSESAAPGTPAFRADFNADGVVSTPDLVTFLGRFAQPCP